MMIKNIDVDISRLTSKSNFFRMRLKASAVIFPPISATRPLIDPPPINTKRKQCVIIAEQYLQIAKYHMLLDAKEAVRPSLTIKVLILNL